MSSDVTNAVVLIPGPGQAADAGFRAQAAALFLKPDEPESRDDLEAMLAADRGSWRPATLSVLVPRPLQMEAVLDLSDRDVLLGLAARPDADWALGVWDRVSDPDGMMGSTRTRTRILEREGLQVGQPDLQAAAEAIRPGCGQAAQSVLDLIEATGSHNAVDWQAKAWGTRAEIDEARFMTLEDGSLSVLFDSVNDPPLPVFEALARLKPDWVLQGAAFDESDDRSWTFRSNGEGGLDVQHSRDPEDLEEAHLIIYGHPRERPDDDDEPDDSDEGIRLS